MSHKTLNIPFAERDLLKVSEYCALNGLGRSTVFALIKSGKIASIKIGRSRRIVNRPLYAGSYREAA